jgi:SAM-dependent methyltransferase
MSDRGPVQPGFWDHQAVDFDQEPDHGLADPAIRAAWREMIVPWLVPESRLLDLGCGTGSLSLVLAEAGWTVDGLDFSPAMVAQAQAKLSASALDGRARFWQADAFAFRSAAEYQGLICRHLLWLAEDPANVLAGWRECLVPGGRLVLVEGQWHTGVGLPKSRLAELAMPGWELEALLDLSDRADLWGRAVNDERWLAVFCKSPA